MSISILGTLQRVLWSKLFLTRSVDAKKDRVRKRPCLGFMKIEFNISETN